MEASLELKTKLQNIHNCKHGGIKSAAGCGWRAPTPQDFKFFKVFFFPNPDVLFRVSFWSFSMNLRPSSK